MARPGCSAFPVLRGAGAGGGGSPHGVWDLGPLPPAGPALSLLPKLWVQRPQTTAAPPPPLDKQLHLPSSQGAGPGSAPPQRSPRISVLPEAFLRRFFEATAF